MLRLTINGKPYELDEGQSILRVCRSIGIDLPTLCYDERLEAYGGCRLCIVHVEGSAASGHCLQHISNRWNGHRDPYARA